MSFKCNDCKKTIRRVEDIRSCSRCQQRNRATAIPTSHQDSDWVTPALLGYLFGSSFSHSVGSMVGQVPDFTVGGGEMAGAGASGHWDNDSSGGSSNDTSSDSSPSSDSGSSDSGSSGSSDS